MIFSLIINYYVIILDTEEMSMKKDGSILAVFGIVLPTLDIISDIRTVIKLCKGGQAKWGLPMLVPVSLATIFNLPHWWKIEKHWATTMTWKLRLLLLLSVVFQIFPQINAGRILYLGYKKDRRWKKQKGIDEKNICPLGILLFYIICKF